MLGKIGGGEGDDEDEMVGWHHRLYGHEVSARSKLAYLLELEKALGVGDGQGSLACCSPCSHQELDSTERLN